MNRRMWILGLAALGALIPAAILTILAVRGGAGSSANAEAYLTPTATWTAHCELGPAPGPYHSWDELFAHATEVAATYGPPPTPDPASFPTPKFDGPPPPGFSSWQAFENQSLKLFDEIQASGAQGRANCTGKQVCVQTSRGPVCTAPAGQPGYICMGPGCPTPEIWGP